MILDLDDITVRRGLRQTLNGAVVNPWVPGENAVVALSVRP